MVGGNHIYSLKFYYAGKSFQSIKEQGSAFVIDNPVIPNEQNNAVLADATHSVADSLQGVLAGCGLQNMLPLFGRENSKIPAGGITGLVNNPIVGNIINSFRDKLTNNHGIPGDQASGIANNLIPNVISNLVDRTNDPNNNSFDIGSMRGKCKPGNSGSIDLQNIVRNFTQGGFDTNSDGKVGFDDIMSKITAGAKEQQQQTQAGGGGLMDMIQGYLK